MTAPLDPFIDRQDLSDYLGRTVTADAGALIAVDAACEICRTVSEQSFNKVTNQTIVVDGTGTDALLLPQRPVSTVTSVLVGADTVTDYMVSDNGLLVRRFTDASQAALTALVWPKGRLNITIRYTHGYDDVPTDVRMVALAIAARLVVQGGAMQEAEGEASVTYAVASTDLTAGERAILRKYKQAL